MKYLKMLGLAGLAAVALMTSVALGSASATVLCKEGKTTGCAAAGQGYAQGTAVEATLASGTSSETIAGGFLEGTCTGSTMKASILNAGSATETVKGSASSLTWSGCTYPTKTKTLGTFEIHWISGTDDGTLTASGFEMETLQPFGTCIYKSGTGNDLGTLQGGNPATTAISTIVTGSGAFGCPSNLIWTATYSFTAPKPLYISES